MPTSLYAVERKGIYFVTSQTIRDKKDKRKWMKLVGK